MQKRVGKRKTTEGRKTRKMIYDLIDESLKTKSKKHFKKLKLLSERKDCPRSMKMIVKEFLRRHNDFKAYLLFPELNIPRTTSALESSHSLYENKSAKIKSPKAWHNINGAWRLQDLKEKLK